MGRPNFEHLKLEVDESLAILTVSRPKALNALNEATLRELKSVCEYFSECAPGAGRRRHID